MRATPKWLKENGAAAPVVAGGGPPRRKKALAVMIKRRIFWATLGRIGRFIYLAFARVKPAAPTTEDSARVPFGLALCIGSGLAIIERVILGRSLVGL